MSHKHDYFSGVILNSHKSLSNTLSVLPLVRFKVHYTMMLVIVCSSLVLCHTAQGKSLYQSGFRTADNRWIKSSLFIKLLNEKLCKNDEALYLDLQIVINASEAGQFIDAARDLEHDGQYGLKGNWSMSTASGGGKRKLRRDEKKQGKYEAKLGYALPHSALPTGYEESGVLVGEIESAPYKKGGTTYHPGPVVYYGYKARYVSELYAKAMKYDELNITNEEAHEAAKSVTNEKLQDPNYASSGVVADNRRIDGKMRKGEGIPEAPDAESLHAIIFDPLGRELDKENDFFVKKGARLSKKAMHCDISNKLAEALYFGGWNKLERKLIYVGLGRGSYDSFGANEKDLEEELDDLAKRLKGPNGEYIGKEKVFIWIDADGESKKDTVVYATPSKPGTTGNGRRIEAPRDEIVIEEEEEEETSLDLKEETMRPDGSFWANDLDFHRLGPPYLTFATSSERFAGPTEVGIYTNDILVDTISLNNDPRGGVYTVSFSDEVLNELIPTLESDPNITIGFELPTAGDYFVLATDDDFWNDPNYPHDEFGLSLDAYLEYMPAEICMVVDNFEDYNDLLGYRPFDIWRDGLVVVDPLTGETTPGNGTGAAVGHKSLPFMEVTTVNSGEQSLPVYINNTTPPSFSETTKALDPPLDFTAQGADILSVNYYIDQTSNLTADDIVYIGIEDDKGHFIINSAGLIVSGESGTTPEGEWLELNLDLSMVDEENFNLSSVTKLYLGVGDRDNPQPGGTGLIYFDDILLLWEHLTAFNPYPADGATDISTKTVELEWSAANIPGVSHNVYFGDNFADVNAATGGIPQALTTFSPAGPLQPETTYYWRVDEVGYDGKVHEGPIWSFTTCNYIVVDDFEDETAADTAWQNWIDGLTNGTGSIVGYFEAPFAETTIVHGGAQSMPMGYNNNESPYYSEATYRLAFPADWTAHGVTELSLWFHGHPENDPEPLYVAISNENGPTAVVVHPDPNAALIDTWTQWDISLELFSNQGVELTDVDILSLGLGTRGNTKVAGGEGKMYFDDIRLYRQSQIPSGKASNPKPEDGAAGQPSDTGFSWQAGEDAVQHDVYLGTDADAVANADTTDTTNIYRGRQGATSYYSGSLGLGQTYYWRVDEVDAAGIVTPGDVWSITITSQSGLRVQYSIIGGPSEIPVLERIDDEINFNLGSGSPDASVPSDNFSAEWTGEITVSLTGTYTITLKADNAAMLFMDGERLIDIYKYNGISTGSVDIYLVAGQMYSIRVVWYHWVGNAICQLYWSSSMVARQIIPAAAMMPPKRALWPNPLNGAEDVKQSPDLNWIYGMNAVSHDVYFGTDKEMVSTADSGSMVRQGQQVRAYTSSAGDKGRQAVTANAASDVYKGRQSETTYSPGPLEWGKTYYWRVDAVEADGTIRKGHVWSFTTADFLHIDDFESYTDNVPGGETVFQTWFDGASNGTGSMVGYNFSANGTFGDTTVFYNGRQSMPLFYNNNQPGSLKYSETLRAFTPALDLTVNGMDTLTFYVQGKRYNGVVPLYVGLQSGSNRTNVTYDDQMIVRSTSWVEVNIPLADFTGVNTGAVNAMYIGLGNSDAPTTGGAGQVFIDAIRATKAAP